MGDDLASLSQALSTILADISKGSTSRTFPVFAAATSSAKNNPNAPGVAYQFVSSFEEKPKLTHSVKVSLETEDGSASELIWVRVTSIDDDTVVGTLDNDPVSDVGLKYGDEVALQKSQVEDWAGFGDGKVGLGGYSIEPDAAATTTTG